MKNKIKNNIKNNLISDYRTIILELRKHEETDTPNEIVVKLADEFYINYGVNVDYWDGTLDVTPDKKEYLNIINNNLDYIYR